MSAVSETEAVLAIRAALPDLLAPVVPVEAEAPAAPAPDAAPGPGRALQSLSDSDILRFWRARKMDVPAAVEMLRKALLWRESSGARRILDQPYPDAHLIHLTCSIAYHKHDRGGRPIFLERTGEIDVLKTMKVVDADAMITRHIWHMEYMARLCEQATAAHGRPITKTTNIFDLKHLSLAPNSVAMALFKATINIDQNYHPERLHKFFFINSPWLFQGLWAVVSPWLDPVTRSKFVILGTDYKETLLEEIAPENLPVAYGGTCTCGISADLADAPPRSSCLPPGCTLTYAQLYEAAGYRPVPLAAGASDAVSVDVPAADGSAVFWCWLTEGKDVMFRATYTPVAAVGEGAHVLVRPEVKCQSDKGFFVPEAPGRLTLHFSNAHSRFTSKVVQCRVLPGQTVIDCRIRTLRPFTEAGGAEDVEAPK